MLVQQTTAQALLWALVATPALVGVGLVLWSVSPSSRRGRWAAPVSVTAASFVALDAIVLAITRPRVGVPFVADTQFALDVEGPAVVVAPTVALVTAAVLVAAAADIRHDRARFHGLMLIFAAAALTTVTAATLPALLLGWEVMGATSYALIGFIWREPHRVNSGLVAFLTTRFADLGLYLAAAAAIAGGAGLVLADLPSADPLWRSVIAAGVMVAAFGKAAQLVFAFWLSRAMDGPSPVSALLHSAAMVAMGGYLLLRLSPLLQATGWAGPVTAWVGALTTVAFGAVAVGQRDLKQLLAASTAAQLGYVVMAAGLGAVSAGTAHLVAHAATKALLFLSAGAWLSALGTKQLAGLRGTVARWPVVRIAASIGLLSLAGAPALSLWATKDWVLAAAHEHSLALYLTGLLGAALSAAYAGTALWVLWRPTTTAQKHRAESLRGQEESPRGVVPAIFQGSLVALAIPAAGLGVLGLPAVATAFADLIGQPLGVMASPVELAISSALAVAVLIAMWWWQAPHPAWAISWFGAERVVQVAVLGPALAISRGAARVDDAWSAALVGAATAVGTSRLPARADDAVAGVVVRSASATGALAGRLARLDDAVDGAVRGVGRVVRRSGTLARRPQSGLLHEYYVQAIVLVALGVVIMIIT